MKLSELGTEQGFAVLADLIEPLAIIIEEENLLKIWFEKIGIKENASLEDIKVLTSKKFVSKIRKIAPIVFKKHVKECCMIISILNEKDLKEVQEQSLLLSLKEFLEIITDKDFFDLALSLMR